MECARISQLLIDFVGKIGPSLGVVLVDDDGSEEFGDGLAEVVVTRLY